MNSHKNRMKGIDEILREDGEMEDVEGDEEQKKVVQVKKLQSDIEQLKVEKGDIAIHLEKI